MRDPAGLREAAIVDAQLQTAWPRDHVAAEPGGQAEPPQVTLRVWSRDR